MLPNHIDTVRMMRMTDESLNAPDTKSNYVKRNYHSIAVYPPVSYITLKLLNWMNRSKTNK